MRKKIRQGQKVAVGFKPRERELVLDHTFASPELARTLRKAQLVEGRHIVRYTLDDLDELLAHLLGHGPETQRVVTGADGA